MKYSLGDQHTAKEWQSRGEKKPKQTTCPRGQKGERQYQPTEICWVAAKVAFNYSKAGLFNKSPPQVPFFQEHFDVCKYIMHVTPEAVERIDFSLRNFTYAQLHKRLSISELLNNKFSDYATS